MVLSNKLEMTGNIWEVRMTTDDEDRIKLKGIKLGRNNKNKTKRH